mgnify:CR=1 FL=1
MKRQATKVTTLSLETSNRKYRFGADMKEISGFGGGYELCCRRMLLAGLEWLDAHPGADPKYHGFRDVFGVALEDNQDARDLSACVVAAAGEYSPSGAQHQAVVSALMWIRQNSWEEYVARMTHPGGEAGILREKLEKKTADYDKLWERYQSADRECAKRGAIIAERVLGWGKFPVHANDQQSVYAPSKATARELRLGDRLSRFVDEAIAEMEG